MVVTERNQNLCGNLVTLQNLVLQIKLMLYLCSLFLKILMKVLWEKIKNK